MEEKKIRFKLNFYKNLKKIVVESKENSIFHNDKKNKKKQNLSNKIAL